MLSGHPEIGPPHRLDDVSPAGAAQISGPDLGGDGGRLSAIFLGLHPQGRLVVGLQGAPGAPPGRRHFPEVDLHVLKVLPRMDAPEAQDLHVLPHHAPDGGAGQGVLTAGGTEKVLFSV